MFRATYRDIDGVEGSADGVEGSSASRHADTAPFPVERGPRVDPLSSQTKHLGRIRPTSPLRGQLPVPLETQTLGAAVGDMFRRYHAVLLKYLRDRLLNKDEAEDIAQEVYYRIARSPHFENVEYPKAFMLRTAKNLLIDINRLRQKALIESPVNISELDVQENAVQNSPESEIYAEEMLKAMEKALSELSPKCVAVFVMNRLQGTSYRQIAIDLNVSETMVGKYMRQALKHLMRQTELDHD